MFVFAVFVAAMTVSFAPGSSLRIIFLVIAWLALTVLINIKPIIQYFLREENNVADEKLLPSKLMAVFNSEKQNAALQSKLAIPVIGVVEPGARAAVERTRGRVGVIATEGTVKSRAYTKAIHAIDARIEVIECPAPLFVPLAEEGWANTHVAREVAGVYLEPLIDAGIDTLVLGCTHYPILRGTIERVVGDSVAIVDSAETTARTVAAAAPPARGGAPEYTFLVTDAEERFKRIASEFLEREVERLELVDLK